MLRTPSIVIIVALSALSLRRCNRPIAQLHRRASLLMISPVRYQTYKFPRVTGLLLTVCHLQQRMSREAVRV